MQNAFTIYKQKGVLWTKECSIFYEKDTLKFKTRTFVLIFARGILMGIIYCTYTLLVFTADSAGISFAVLYSLTSLLTFTTAIAAYYLYREKLGKQHFIGITFLVVAIIVLSLA